jgi:hypothetical protein
MQISLHRIFGNAIYTRSPRTAGGQCNAGGLAQPSQISNQSQQTVKLSFFVFR